MNTYKRILKISDLNQIADDGRSVKRLYGITREVLQSKKLPASGARGTPETLMLWMEGGKPAGLGQWVKV